MTKSETNVQVITPFKRLLLSGMFGGGGVCIAQIVTSTLLLPFKLMALDQKNYSTSFGLITGIAALVAIIMGPVWGAISDRTVTSFGRRRLWILVGIIGGCLQLVGIALASSVTMVTICWILASAFFASNWAINPTIMADQVPESRRGTYGGITGFFSPFATVIGMVLMSLIDQKTIEFKLILVAIIGIVGVLVQVILIKEGKLVGNKAKKEKRSFKQIISNVYPSPRKYPAFTWGIVTKLLVCVLGNLGTYYTIVLLQRFKFPQEVVSSKMSLISATSILFLATASILGGILSDKFRKQKIFIIGSSVTFIIVCITQALSTNFNMFLVASCVGSFAYGLFLSVDTALMIRLLPDKENTGKDVAIINLPLNVATSIVSFVSPLILAFTNWTGYYIIFALIAFVSIFTLLPIPEMTPVPEEEILDMN